MTVGRGKSPPPRPAPNRADQLPARSQPRMTRDFLSAAPSAVNPGPGQDSPGFSAWRMMRIVRADIAIYPPFRTTLRDHRVPHNLRSIIIALMWAIALAGLRLLGQVLAQFMIVWQR